MKYKTRQDRAKVYIEAAQFFHNKKYNLIEDTPTTGFCDYVNKFYGDCCENFEEYQLFNKFEGGGVIILLNIGLKTKMREL